MPTGTMRAAVYRGPDDVRVERLPIPCPRSGEVLVRVAACGVCATDLKKIHGGTHAPPRVFGHEIAGEVAEVGAGVETWRPGDRVVVNHHVPCGACHFCAHGDYAQCPTYRRTASTAGFEPAGGGFAEFVLVLPWAVDAGLVRIPDGVADEDATFVEPVNTCLKGVRRLNATAGDTVVVFGQGQIGLLFTQILTREGIAVVAVEPLEARRRVAQRYGACPVPASEVAALHARVAEQTGGRGADAAVVAVPSEAAVAAAMGVIRPGGKTLLFAHTHLGDPVQVDAGAVCEQEKSLLGSYSSDITLQEEAARLVFRGSIDVAGLVTHRYSLDDIGEALAAASSPDGRALKVMVIP